MAKKLLRSPKGIAVYPHLNTPDTKYKDEGEYHVKLRSTAAAGADLKAQIDALAQEALQEAKAAHAEALREETNPEKLKRLKKQKVEMCDNMPYDEDEETGEISFNFKMKASGISKKTNKPWSRKPALYDAKLNVLSDDVIIGGGSTIYVSFSMEKFFTYQLGAGVTLRLEGVQVIDLKAFSKDAKSLGFEEEDGFEGASGESDSKAAFAAKDADEDASEENDEDGEDTSPDDF